MIKNILFIFLSSLPLLINAQQIQAGEMLGRPTEKSIEVRVIFSEDAEVYSEFGLTPDDLTGKTPWTAANAGNPVQIVINNLEPDKRYYYRLVYRKPGTNTITKRPVFSFQTQRKEGSPFTFVIQADPHLDEQSDTSLYRRCLKNQLEDQPDFIVDLGDIIMTDKLKNSEGKITRDTIAKRCQYLRSFYETACHSSPLFIVLGNHEGENGWTPSQNGENTAVWSTLERKKYYANPSPNEFYSGDDTQHPYVGLRENYYSWTWGDVLFVVLDPYWYTSPKPDANTGWRWTLGKKQYDWLKKTLEESTSTYKLVFCHQLVGGDPNGRGGIEFADWYEWGGYNNDGSYGFATNRPGWYKPIKDLLTENKVNVFFHGHDHFFGMQEKDCLIYQECPQPSHPGIQNANQAAAYGYVSGKIIPNSGHIRVTVQPEEMKIEYVRAFLPSMENATRKNKDVAATYFIKKENCYDTLSSVSPVLWNHAYQNECVFPNPFDQSTRITFELNHEGPVDLIIYNEQGKPVTTMLSQQSIANGKYDILWDGRDNSNHAVPPGIYYYIIKTPRIQESGSLIRIK